jgi:RNase P subunit RPR2
LKRTCPNCNSPQSFKAAKRVVGKGRAEIFIRCTMCRWEVILYAGTERQVRLKQDIDKLRGKALRGDPVKRVLQKRQERLRDSL